MLILKNLKDLAFVGVFHQQIISLFLQNIIVLCNESSYFLAVDFYDKTK